jgi:hypothetical protein
MLQKDLPKLRYLLVSFLGHDPKSRDHDQVVIHNISKPDYSHI